MVASLLRLRLLSFGNRITRPRSRAEAVGTVVGVVVVLSALVGIAVFDAVASRATPELRGAGFVVLGSAVVAGFWLLPFAFRADDPMPPRAFAAFEIPPGRLAAGLALARLLSVPAVLLLLLLVVQAHAWRDDAPAVLLSIVAGIVLLAVCILGSQVAAAVASRDIVGRNAAGLLTLTAVAIGAPLAAALASLDWAASGVTYLRRAAAVLDWTPFGILWSAPSAAATGDPGLAWGRIAIGVAIAAILGALWYWIVRRAGSTVPRAESVRSHAGLGVFDVVPPIPGGVIAARTIVYWMRDPRYVVPLLILPIVPLIVGVSFSLAGIPSIIAAWICVPLVALLIGWSVHNDVAADGTAFWLHVVTGVDGRADRWGRLVPTSIVGAVVVIGGSYVTAAIVGDWSMLLPLLALGACTLLVGLGVGSAASAVAPYPTVLPGNGPFAQPQATRGGEAAKPALSLLVAAVLCLPAVGVLVAGLVSDPALVPVAIWLSLGSGVVVLLAGIELGALVVSRRAPEILAFTQQN